MCPTSTWLLIINALDVRYQQTAVKRKRPASEEPAVAKRTGAVGDLNATAETQGE